MKPFLLVLGALAATGLVAAENIPIENFARLPLVTQAKISPDGEYVAFLRDVDGRAMLFLTDLESRTLSNLEPGEMRRTHASQEIRWFDWVNNKRLVFTTVIWDHVVTGISAADRDGRQWRKISGPGSSNRNADPLYASTVLGSLEDSDQSILAMDRHAPEGEEILYPDVVKVSTLTGFYSTVAKNPGNVVAWGADPAGCVRLGVTVDGTKFGVLYRESEKVPWRALAPLDPERGRIQPLGFETSDQRLYVAALSPQKRWAIYPYDPGKGVFGGVLVADPDYDIIPEKNTHVALARPIFSANRTELLGAYYLTDKPHVRWLDEDYARYQRIIDRALPDTFNLITSRSKDDRRLLVFAFSDRDPGTYFVYDRVEKSLTLVATCMKWINPEQMAPMQPIKYAARDGLIIHGYLTAPVGGPREKKPLVVLPHGGPWDRDIWAFEPLVQMLASRGYAVLQMDYRGSTGYGQEFHDRGLREFGGAMQTDIEDGVRWAIQQGVADPRRIAIVGGSFGGYAALFALGHNPELYRCGVSIAGVTDWPTMFEKLTEPEYKVAREFWVEEIGDPGADQAELRAMSPVNFADKITAPVLIIQGKEDPIVPPKQAREMAAALKKAGRPPEVLFLNDAGHGLRTEEARVEAFKSIAAFLEKNLRP